MPRPVTLPRPAIPWSKFNPKEVTGFAKRAILHPTRQFPFRVGDLDTEPRGTGHPTWIHAPVSKMSSRLATSRRLRLYTCRLVGCIHRRYDANLFSVETTNNHRWRYCRNGPIRPDRRRRGNRQDRRHYSNDYDLVEFGAQTHGHDSTSGGMDISCSRNYLLPSSLQRPVTAKATQGVDEVPPFTGLNCA
jgi:hypothetical protein